MDKDEVGEVAVEEEDEEEVAEAGIKAAAVEEVIHNHGMKSAAFLTHLQNTTTLKSEVWMMQSV